MRKRDIRPDDGAVLTVFFFHVTDIFFSFLNNDVALK